MPTNSIKALKAQPEETLKNKSSLNENQK